MVGPESMSELHGRRAWLAPDSEMKARPVSQRINVKGTGLTALAASLALLAAACGAAPSHNAVANIRHGKTTTTAQTNSPSATTGGPGGGGGASLNSSSAGGSGFAISGESYSQALKFAQCMRSHGLANFPDPSASGGFQFGSSSGVNPGSSQFQAASNSCRKYMPKGAQPSPAQRAKALANALKFSQCMRSHGLSDFPDPQSAGNGISIRIKGSPGSDLDPNNPQFQAAQKACQGIMGGPKQAEAP